MSVPASEFDQASSSSPVASKLRELRHFINGEFVPAVSGGTFENINPATGQVIGRVAEGTAADIDRAVQTARKAFEEGPWSRMPMAERCSRLKDIGDRILARVDEMALAETLDTGKPISESREGDIPRSAQNFHFYAEFAAQLQEECYSVGPMERHFAVREPLGVVGLITPWNLPLYLSSWKIAPALAMGNSVVLKPAEWTPTTATILAEIFQEADMPPGVFNVVHGFGRDAAGEALTRHPDVRAISFTGETTTGKAIMKAAADTLKKVSFELGGKGASIVFDDADLDEALPVIVRAAFRNQGQICLAGSRLFVQSAAVDRLVPRLVAAVEALRVGDPLDAQTQMGSIISREQLDKVEQYIALGKQEGQVLTGGERLGSPHGSDAQKSDALQAGFFLKPTVVQGLTNDSRLCQEEIFGPVLPIVVFDTEEELLSMVNSTAYGLSASIWSRDVNRCHRVSQGIRTGIVWVNCWFARDLRTPFGGMKSSGVGREGGRYSLDFFSEAKAICYRYS